MLTLCLIEIAAAPANALIAINKEKNKAIIVLREIDGGVDDTRLEGKEDFFPLNMLFEKNKTIKVGDTIELEGGGWTTIPYIKQQSKDYCETYQNATIKIVD